MSVRITGVEKGSIAEKKRLKPGDILLKINGNDIIDVLDYRFYITDEHLALEVEEPSGGARTVEIEKGEYEDIGLEFATYLMDRKQSCRNHCIFCFIDQLPPGLREPLYFKDDDARLSFLMGNYITLTNLSEREVERIIAMHLSPVNVSVHTTNPELRVKMMRNKNAGASLSILKRLASRGIQINCQIVLCKGVNDGAELERTLRDLSALYPSVESVAVVPVGLTKYRRGLFELQPFEEQDCLDVLGILERFGAEFLKRHGTRLVYPADEFYLRAGRPVPGASFYEGFHQLENGVGLIADLNETFEKALRETDVRKLAKPRKISLATGTAASGFIRNIVKKMQNHIAGLDCLVYPIENRFFGETVNVAGLITAKDLISQLQGADLGGELLIPAVMLRRERDVFLDGLSVEDVSRALGVKVTPVENDGDALLGAALGRVE